MKTITYRVNVDVADGPKAAVTRLVDVEAYHLINVDLAPGDTDKAVEVAQGDVQLLFISLAQDYPQDKPVTYKVKGVGGGFTLDAPHFLVGKSTKDLLGRAPEVLQFTNDGANPKVTVQILVGRDATP